GRDQAAEIAEQAGGDDDQREWGIEEKYRAERGCGDDPQRRMPERARRDAVRGGEDDGDDGRLDAVEDPGDQRHVAMRDVDPRERDEDEYRRQDEEAAGNDAAPGAVHQP